MNPPDVDREPDADRQAPVRRLTEDEQRQALEAIARVQKLRDESAEKYGRMKPESWELLNESRDERIKHLTGDSDT